MEIKEFTVQDRMGDLTLTGRILSERRWEHREHKTRWTDMVLYRVVDKRSPYQYALQMIARSRVYHRFGGPCVKKHHRIRTVESVRKEPERWKGLSACWNNGCKPPELDLMNSDDVIAEERDEPHLLLCSNASDILDKLYHHKGEIGILAGSVLREAAKVDPFIAQAWKHTRRV